MFEKCRNCYNVCLFCTFLTISGHFCMFLQHHNTGSQITIQGHSIAIQGYNIGPFCWFAATCKSVQDIPGFFGSFVVAMPGTNFREFRVSLASTSRLAYRKIFHQPHLNGNRLNSIEPRLIRGRNGNEGLAETPRYHVAVLYLSDFSRRSRDPCLSYA